MKKMFIAGLITLALPLMASAQVSTITGTLSSGGTVSTSSGSTLTGTVTPSPGSGSLTGTVGGGSGTLTGTVTSPSASSGGGGGGGGSNGPPAGGGGGGGGSGLTIVCPNLPNSLYALPAGYVVIDGNCDPSGSVLGASTTIPNIPNTGAGGNAPTNFLVLALSALGTLSGIGYLSRYRKA